MDMHPERTLLIGLDTGEYDAQSSMDELEELAQSAGGEVVARMIQRRATPDGASYLGEGRLNEAEEFCDKNEVELIIADGELTPTQQRNIEKKTGVRTIDRTMLILDIFALNARTSEGKLQVALAQLEYSLPRLTGKGSELSRLGGGIGTRGPGESKLESDRRHIRRRIHAVKSQLEQVKKRRENIRQRRKKDRIETVAIVGYTNAGKSTLMNTLTSAGVLTQNKLFATLDPTSRFLRLPDGRDVMVTDTVGFIRRLPHHLVDAFRSTLEEVLYADVIVNVCDASSDEAEEHLKVTRQVLDELGVGDTPVISVYNKCDLLPENTVWLGKRGDVKISALKGEGIDELLNAVAQALPKTRYRVKALIPFENGDILGQLEHGGAVHSLEYVNEGTIVDVTAPVEYLESIKRFILPPLSGEAEKTEINNG